MLTLHFQEMKTGMNTGLSDYILQHAPFAASMANAKYDEYYRSEGLLFSYVIWTIILLSLLGLPGQPALN